MADIEFQLTGAKELDALLKSVPKKEAMKGIRKGTRAGAKLMLAKARALAPVRTGLMRQKLTVRAAKRKRPKALGAKVQGGKRAAMKIPENSKWYYPAIVEFGRKDGKLQGSHFMLRAAEATASAATNRTLNEIKTQIESAKALRGGS